jgi:hypothetical protein
VRRFSSSSVGRKPLTLVADRVCLSLLLSFFFFSAAAIDIATIPTL